MAEFWENNFLEKQTMWGFEPSESAIIANDFFLEQKAKDILIPGVGYGRNAKLFQDNGIKVTGIEISKTAIALARKYYGDEMKIYHGSVTEMPFDNHLYDGVFCYGLIYLLNREERKKLIVDCYSQLQPNGYMIFSVISKNSPNYGTGRQIGKDRFEIPQGAKLFFYDENSIRKEFEAYGLTEFTQIDEPVKNMKKKPPFKFWFVKCRK
jgi:SAM-dependent methyltransferase